MTVMKTYMARKIDLGKDVQHIQASVIVRVFSTAFLSFLLTTASMKGFVPWRYF